MNKTTKIALLAGAAAVIAVGLVFAIRMNPTSTNDGRGTIAAPVATVKSGQTTELSPFTNVATVPATIDPSTIRFEKLRTVDLASKTETTSNPQDCKERQFREPDGSGCTTTKVVERVKALEARYSYAGVEVASGEATPGRDSFSVYFRPEEVSIDGPADKLKRDQAAALFQISTYRPMVEQKVIDNQNSHMCPGNYVDGNWMHTDPNCHDQIQYISKTVPSQYLTVQVDVRQPATKATN